ncbi:MAG: protein kinase [Labilithrix sp.]|nr:protein kinase [Labilithrix sp.]MCW5811335.1 protein kinase [Labilithrix sp.]
MERVIADRFVVERLVGSGGMGEVFRAHDKVLGGPVAIKVLYTSMKRDADRFKQEAQILADISHPRIVRYVAHGMIEGGRPWLAMEWLEGEDLADRLERSGLGLRDALLLARRTAEALAALHDRNVVHRDVKPSNIFLTDNDVDRAKVLDLGVARLLHGAQPSTRSGVMVGTPGYMAPEQARGTREIDARADVFALGCVLYECIAGRPAFQSDNIASLLAKILLETPPSLREIGCEIPLPLDELVQRMLAKAPAARPASAAAVLKELETFGAIADGPAVRASTPAMRALTAGERRLVCVVMSTAPALAQDDSQPDLGAFGPTDSGTETMAASFDPRTLVTSFGAEAEVLADGTIVATLTGMGGAGDQAAQAARCALALRSHLIDAPVVLATGLATVTGRSAVGEVIERAAAILASARVRHGAIGEDSLGGQSPVFLDETTAGLLDMGFDVGGDERGLFIRGLRERDAKARTLLGKPTPFVGRDRELSTLEALFEECANEPVARAVLVTGFPGAGKSRLVAEMMRQMQRPGVELWLARGDAMSQGSPFALALRLLRRGAGITGGEPLVVRQQKLRARVARHVAEADVVRVTEFLGEVASIPFNDTDSVQLRAARQDVQLMGDQMRRAFCDLVLAESRANPFVLVLEDLHWGDLPSVNLLDAALRAANEQSFMVLAVARGEVHDAFPQLWAQRSLQEVRLGPLVRRAGEKLVRDVLGEDLPATEVARLLDRAAGNVFYLEELIRAFAEGTGRVTRASIPPPGTIPPPPTSSTVMNAGEPWSLPTTVLAMVEARLQRLDPMARRVMRAASVFGEAFWRGGVVALTGGQYKATEIDEWIAELVRREIVQRRDNSRFELETEYAFRHAIVRDAAYQMLTTEDQELGHRLAADWLEKAGEDDPMVLGEHFERGGNRARAAFFYARAAFQALEGNDFVAAKLRADRALQAGAGADVRGQLQLVLAEASRWSGEHEAARGHALAALEALEARSADWYVAAAEATESAMTLGHVDEAHGIARRLTEDDAPMSPARVIASSRIAVVLGVTGMYDVATQLLAPIERATELLDREPAARAFLLSANVSRALWEPDLERAVVLADSAIASFEEIGDARNATRQRQKAGWALAELGAYDEAEAILTRARADAERLGLVAVANDATLRLAFVCVRTGRYDHAVALTNEIIAAYSAQRDRAGEAHARAYLASVYYFGGHFSAAATEARGCLALIEHSPPYRAAVLGFLALTLMHEGAPPAEVVATAKEAFDLLEELTGIAEGEAVVRIAYAEALHYAEDLEGAKKAVASARDRLLARAAKIGNASYKRSFLGAVRENSRTLARAGEWLA